MVRNLFTISVEELNNRLTAEGKQKEFSIFIRHDFLNRTANDRIGLESIAEELAIPLSDGIDSIATSRRRFQGIVTELVCFFTSSESEFRKEMPFFFGAWISFNPHAYDHELIWRV